MGAVHLDMPLVTALRVHYNDDNKLLVSHVQRDVPGMETPLPSENGDSGDEDNESPTLPGYSCLL